ncbi:Protein csx2 [Candida viswanathii]|uniref:ADP-ribosylation factor GTPase-activating protein n=1 Tax=Candida viswanathii TaxID=5486 RepID=A0A367XRY7_9ASCO|nr:Protein csx2 [Candida viswanathii]
MDLLGRLAFPYFQDDDSTATLSKLILTDELDSRRTILSLNDKKQIESLKLVYTNTQQPIHHLPSYIENPDREEKDTFPLLVKVSPEFSKIKFHVSIKPETGFASRSLVIVKSIGITDVDILKNQLYDDTNPESSRTELSRLQYSKLPIDGNNHVFQKVIINDFYDPKVVNDTKLTISLWEHDSESNDFRHLLNFSLWIDKLPVVEQRINTSLFSLPTKGQPLEDKSPESKLFNLGDFRKEFSIDIEDGPEFRKTLTKLENSVPFARKVYSSLIDEFKSLESSVRKISASKIKIMDAVDSLVDLESASLLREFGFKHDFHVMFRALFEPFEKNIAFFFENICDYKTLTKVYNNIGLNQVDSVNPQAEMQRKFESDSKEYYSWLNKYLSNEKERPELKLLAKRKVFELSKFDYLNNLSKVTNNQYVNVLVENLFKFLNLKYDERHPRFLDYRAFKDKKSNQNLLGDNYQIYLNVLLRFNSEKYQFRQMIEACQTNEELTNLIRHNRLNHKPTGGATSSPPTNATNSSSNLIASNIDEFIVTKENFDLIFSDSEPPNHETSSDDAEKSGILFTLGGQKKQGWHKEWVVLEKGQLIEYADWRKGRTPINRPIEIALASVKAITYDKRQFCFEVLTSTGTRRVFQAFDNEDRNKWVKALYNAGQLVNTLRLEKSFGRDLTREGRKKTIGKLITDFKEKPVIPGQDRSISPISLTSKAQPVEKDYLHLVRSIPNSDNSSCLDCGSMELVEWISINTLSCFCVKCASCHRNIGSHITKIRSLKLDKFENETELLLKYINNRKVNSYLEENLPPEEKIKPEIDDEHRLQFIKNKYLLKKYKSVIPDVNNLLIKAIQKINISDVLKYILCGGDINLNIQINIPNKNEYLVISLFEYSLRKYIEITDDYDQPFGGTSKKLFIISELLILNGCKVSEHIKDLQKEDLGLTDAAIEYWKIRSLKLSGTRLNQ